MPFKRRFSRKRRRSFMLMRKRSFKRSFKRRRPYKATSKVVLYKAPRTNPAQFLPPVYYNTMTVKFPFTFTGTMTANETSSMFFVWNDISDINAAAAGGDLRAQGFEQLSDLYDNWRVNACSINILIDPDVDNLDPHLTTWICYPWHNAEVGSNTQQFLSKPRARSVTVLPNQRKPQTIRVSTNLMQLEGFKTAFEENFSGGPGATSPANLAYFRFGACSHLVTDTAVSCSGMITMTFKVKWYRLNRHGASSTGDQVGILQLVGT